MNRTLVISMFAVLWLRVVVLADPSPVVTKPAGVNDPRLAKIPVILFHNQKNHRDGLEGPLLVYARHDIEPPNQILGIEGSFTDEQIITGLRKFYREWRPPADDANKPRPQLILAKQNWGCGAALYEPLKAISAEFEIDVYKLYPVIRHIESNPIHPTPNDKRLGELIKGK